MAYLVEIVKYRYNGGMGLFSFLKNSNNDDIIKPPMSAPQAGTAPVASGNGVMEVDDVFSIKGRGTVATGRVESGSFSVGETVTIQKQDGTSITTTIASLEAFRKTLDVAQAGDNCGMLLRDVERSDIESGDQIIGSVN